MHNEAAKYPIGKFTSPQNITAEHINQWVRNISTFPERLKMEVNNLTDSQLDTPYRSEGWTLRQVIHHCADSHMNAFIRFKLALTEDSPIIKPYMEERWAELLDSKTYPIQSSIKILEGIHDRWVALINSLSAEQLKKIFVHPEHGRQFTPIEVVGTYAWHSNHHLAHITTLKKNLNWS